MSSKPPEKLIRDHYVLIELVLQSGHLRMPWMDIDLQIDLRLLLDLAQLHGIRVEIFDDPTYGTTLEMTTAGPASPSNAEAWADA